MTLLPCWLIGITLGLQLDAAAPTATPVAEREQSWEQHTRMRRESQFYSLRWKSIGPVFQGGRIECIAVDPEQPSTMYVGVGSGGLWKTINNGLTWTPTFEQQSSIAVGDVAVAATDPKTVWLGTGEVLLARSALPGMGIFKSEDAGRTWTNMGLKDTQHIARVLVDPRDAERVFVAAIGHQNSANPERGVFRTDDGGKTWSRVLYSNDHTAAIDLVMHPSDSNVLYASMWQRATEGQQHSGKESGIYKSTDGGESWTRLTNGLPVGDNVGRIAIAMATAAPDRLYALVDEGELDGFYRSTDAGQSWSRTYDRLQARWDWCEIRVSPDDPNEVYSIGQNSFVTRDGGLSFTKIAGDIVHLLPHGADVIHLDTHAMWINPTDSEHIVFGTDGGIFVTHDRCRTWLHLNNMPIAECYAATYDMREPFNVYVGTQDNAALYGPVTHRPRTGRPDAWKHVYLDPWGGGDSYFTYRDPVDDQTIYYEHQYGELRRKNMATGVTDDIQPRLDGEELRCAWMTPFFPSHHNGQTLYYAANRVFKSTNRGDSWLPISPDLVSTDVVRNARYQAITALAESPVDAGTLFAGTDQADMFVTTDDGENWSRIEEGLPKRSFTRIFASPHDAQRVFVAQSGAGIDDYSSYVFRSDDQGNSWTSIGDGLPAEPVNVIVEDPRVAELLYVGTDMGVYVSLDGGRQWQSLCANLPTASVYDLFVHPRDNVLVVATHGRSCYAMDAQPIQDAAQAITTIGDRRELFVDEALIEELTGSACLKLQRPEPGQVVLTADEAWEGNTSAYFTIFQDEDRYRAWYRGSHYDEQSRKSAHAEVTCYAESRDGIHWTKPDLGLFEFAGSKQNNIVWDDVGSHCFTPFKDTNPDCRPEARYKAVSRGRPHRPKGLYAFQSADGIHWSLIQQEPIITEGAFDSQNLAFWDAHSGCYRCYHRNFRDGIRDIMVQTSDDFLHWSPPEYISIPNAPHEHLYTNAVQPYYRAPHLLIGFPTRYLPEQSQRVEPTFMSSRDGYTFHRCAEALIPESAPEDRAGNRSNYMVHGLLELPGEQPGSRELAVFGTEAYYTGPDNRVRRFSYRIDGFVSLHADNEPGRMTSRPLVFSGNKLLLNFRTQAEGYVKIDIHDLYEPTRSLSSGPLTGDAIDQPVPFDSEELSCLAGTPVRLVIELRDADVFSFKFETVRP
ncbi:MAG: hypothetical protein NXI32_20340 [bacterium]|nr:hypothetical protein [bacterium]